MAFADDPFTMFGHGSVVGELIEVIHATGGCLWRVVENIPEVRRAGRPCLGERLARYRDPTWNPAGVNRGLEVEVVQIADFVPRPGERYVMGFTGVKNAPLVRLVAERHGIVIDTLVHPAALVSPTARVDAGCVVHATAIIGSCAHVGAHTYVNKGALVGHDAVVGEHCVIAPGAKVGGHGRLGRGVFLGMGAIVLEDRVVGDHAVVAAGAVVTSDVPARVMAAGMPARVRKSLEGPAGER